MKARIEFGLSATAKPNIEIKIDEIDGTETLETRNAIREIALEEFQFYKEKLIKEYGSLKLETVRFN